MDEGRVLTCVCMLGYWMWDAVPIWFLYASVLIVGHCADLVSVFFGTYGDTLCRSAIWFWDSSVLMVVRCADPVSGFFDIYDGTL